MTDQTTDAVAIPPHEGGSTDDNVRRLTTMIEEALDDACRHSLFEPNPDVSMRQQVDAYVADVRENPIVMGVTRELAEGFDIEEARRTGIIDMVLTWPPPYPLITIQVPV